MINEIIFMKGYGIFVWSAFSFTVISFTFLYTLVKINLVKEQVKFAARLRTLNKTKIKLAKAQSINREISATSLNSKI